MVSIQKKVERTSLRSAIQATDSTWRGCIANRAATKALDQTFFVIRAMALTGQQGGQVNLRLRVSTWLRRADAEASGLPATPESGAAAAGKEGQ